MKQYFINLKRNLSKKQHMETMFPNAERIEGVEGALLDKNSILPFVANREWRDPYWNRRLTKGEIGCALSHIEAWKKCIELNEPIIVLEDDIVPVHPSWEQEVQKYLNTYDLLYLSRKLIEGVPENINQDLETPGFSYWTCAYLISPKLARELIYYSLNNGLIPADEVLPLVAGLHRTFSYESSTTSAAFKTNILQPKEGAFSASSTETPLNIWEDFDFHILTVATDESKAPKLLNSSYEVLNLGKDVEWKGGTMQGPGGGQKINLIKEQLEHYNDNDIIMFLDGYDTFITSTSKQEILQRYFSFRSEIVFSSEKTCWPDRSIEDQFPETLGYKFLNSGCFIGTVKALKNVFKKSILDHEDDQLYCQKEYLAKTHNIVLDYESYIFFSLSRLENYVDYVNGYLVNKDTNCTSLVLHGNGGEETKKVFDHMHSEIFKGDFYIPKQEYRDIHFLDKDIFVLYNFLSNDFCDDLIAECEKLGEWQELKNDIYPAQEIRLKKLNSIYYEAFNKAYLRKIVPLVENRWSPLKMYGIRDLFTIKYSMDTQRKLNLHHDMSLVSGSLKLNNNYSGGELHFPRQGVSNSQLDVGSIILWPGQVTHPHECKELQSGVKYSLTLWTSRLKGTDDIYTG